MAFADSNRVLVRYVEETDWGVTPASTAFTEVRLTSESLAHQKETTSSNELRSDRQRSAILEVSASASGDIQFEFSHRTFNDFIAGALQGSWTAVSTIQSATFTSTTITLSTTVVDSLEQGQWFRVGSAGANNGIFRVASKASNVITVEGGTFATTTTVSTAVIRANTCKNGTTRRSFTVEREYDDISKYGKFTGMRANTLALQIEANSIVTGTIGFMGKEGAFSASSAATSTNAATTTNPVTATANVGALYEGSFTSALTTAMKSISLSLNNNERLQQAVGSRTAVGIGEGTLDATGSYQAYLADLVILQKFVNHTESLLSFRFVDDAGNVDVVTIESLYLTNSNAPAAGLNQDVMVNADWSARRDPTLGYTLRWDSLSIA